MLSTSQEVKLSYQISSILYFFFQYIVGYPSVATAYINLITC